MPRLLVLLAALVLLTGCAGGSSSDSPNSPDSSDGPGASEPGAGQTGAGQTGDVDLQGTYVTDSIDSVTRQLVPGSKVRLVFADGSVDAEAGCNRMGGAFSLESGRLVVGEMRSTAMGCPEDLMAQDEWLATFLEAKPKVALDGDTLTLTGDEVTMRLVDELTATPPLQNTSWQLDTVVTGAGADGTASSVPSGARNPAIKFTNGVVGWDVTFSTGCNTGHGAVRVGSKVLDFGDLATTRMACPGAVGELEKTYLGVLGRGTTYTLQGNRLTLTAADGKSGLVFVAG